MTAVAILQQQARPRTPPVPVPPPIPDDDYEAFYRQEARRRGIDEQIAVIVANSEGSLTEPARLGDFSGPPWYSGKSWWALQLHYGGRGPLAWQDYSSFGHTAGMGNSFTAITGWAPGDPGAWRDSIRYGLDHARRYGWGAWYGAAAHGILGFRGIDQSMPWNGTPIGEWDYRRGT